MSVGFLRQQGNYKKRLKKKWCKPKGHHSKLGEKRRGMHKMPNIGYRKPLSERTKLSLIHNLSELESFKKGDVVTITSSIGARKKMVLYDYCMKKGIIITNTKDLKKKSELLKEGFDKRLSAKKKAELEKKKALEAKKKAEAKKKKVAKKKVVVKKKKTNKPIVPALPKNKKVVSKK